jgi:hypothetical protein
LSSQEKQRRALHASWVLGTTNAPAS